MPQTDILIIGSGIAGLAVASESKSKNVTILTKKNVRQSNSALAQGGIAAAMSEGDHWEDHFRDTIKAGCYHNDEQAVELMVKSGPDNLKAWIDRGFPVDRDASDEVRLGKEGAHQKRRILHAGGDQTGKLLVETMLNHLPEHIKIEENLMATDLIIQDGKCLGAMVLGEDNAPIPYYANFTVLATGGIGGLYETNSNSATISGDGLAMAYRAGCQLKDLEFVQFHPTLLYVSQQGKGLISEAVRGEGAILVTENGVSIMEGVHPMKDLAPRDVVARTLFSYLLKGEAVYLDISMIPHFQERFPAITELCLKNGIDLASGRIPVAPGAHFHMGGIKTNPSSETNIKNLYAVGEAACLGAHGANRLASNSLLEGLVFGTRLGRELNQKDSERPRAALRPLKASVSMELPEAEAIQRVMTEKVGIVRTERELHEAISWFESFGVQHRDLEISGFSKSQLQTWNMLTAGWLIAKAALERKNSVGAHYMEASG